MVGPFSDFGESVVQVRPYMESDLGQVVRLFTASIHSLASSHYDEVQRAAWAPQPPNLDDWRQRLAQLRTVVVEEAGTLAGFLSYASDGRIDLLYTAPAAARSGVASKLYSYVESALRSSGVRELTTEASLVARPFFERHGFRVVEEEVVSRRGVFFRRLRMRKRLA